MQGAHSKSLALLAATALLLGVCLPATSMADATLLDSRDHVLVLAVDQSSLADSTSAKDGESNERAFQLALKKLTAEVAQRLEVRLLAAGMRGEATPLPRGRVRVSLRTRKPRSLIEGVLTGSGEMMIRPALDQSTTWSELGAMLPGTIELREDARGATIAWSSAREPLLAFTSQLTMSDGEFFVVPAKGGGWRTLFLGEAVLTHAQLERARQKSSTVGLSFIQMSFDASGQAALRAIKAGASMALIVDGEVITTFMAPDTSRQATLSLRCSDVWVPASQQSECIEVVVGRLAAQVPMKVTIMRTSE